MVVIFTKTKNEQGYTPAATITTTDEGHRILTKVKKA